MDNELATNTRLTILETTMTHIQEAIAADRETNRKHIHDLREVNRIRDAREMQVERDMDARVRNVEKHVWMGVGALGALQFLLHLWKP